MNCDENLKTVHGQTRYDCRSLPPWATPNKPKARNLYFHKLVGNDNSTTFDKKVRRLC